MKLKILSVFCTLLCFIFLFGPAYSQNKDLRLLPGVKGQDDRMLVDNKTGAWRAVGRINVGTGGHCTGTLVAPKTVITAAHCVWNKRTLKWYPPVSLHFLAGYTRGEYAAHARVVKIKAPEAFIHAKKSKKLTHDWAILTLDSDLGQKIKPIKLASFEFVRSIQSGEKILQAGYSQDSPHMLTLNQSCQVNEIDRNHGIMFHDCDTVKGDSGSPIFYRRSGKYSVIGIHVATATSVTPTRGIAVLISNFRGEKK